MNYDAGFEALWHQEEFEVPGSQEELCSYGQFFSEWAALLIAKAEERHTSVAVNQSILRLTHKYFEWRTVVPKSHRNRIGEQGHRCIFHVFEAAYLKLKMLELALQPPPLSVPTTPPLAPPPPPMQIAGIFLGQDDD